MSPQSVIFDVREQDEFDAEHVPNSVFVPLSQFAHLAPEKLASCSADEIVLMCRSGTRAKLALEQFRQLGYSDRFKATVFDGGILEWKKQGKAVVQRKRFHLPVMRQTQIVIGAGVLGASIGVLSGSPAAAWLSAFFGAGLLFAGSTGWCGLALLLARMPWNQGDTPACETR